MVKDQGRTRDGPAFFALVKTKSLLINKMPVFPSNAYFN
jgi:hypothetical protein